MSDMEYDPDHQDSIRLFRLRQLENVTPQLMNNIATRFNWVFACQVQSGVTTTCTTATCEDRVCLWKTADTDPALEGILPTYTLIKATIEFDTRKDSADIPMLFKADPWFLDVGNLRIGFDPCTTEILGKDPAFVADKNREKHTNRCDISDDDSAKQPFETHALCIGGKCSSRRTTNSGRIYPVNHECFTLRDDGLTREAAGTTQITGAQDDRVTRF
ncbi:hypothetical protein T484DRAFT_3648627, partial [Baffinella frigidus]